MDMIRVFFELMVIQAEYRRHLYLAESRILSGVDIDFFEKVIS